MTAEQARPGGRYVFIERGGREVPVPVMECAPQPAPPPATAPLWELARIRADAMLVMARLCGVSIPEFCRRYAT